MIHPYSYKPAASFGTRGHENLERALTFGVECECDNNHRVHPTMTPAACSDLVDDASAGRIYCKSDASIGGGFEMVSHPGTLAHHMYMLRWKNALRMPAKAGFRSHDTVTAGLHVHVGRQQLGANDEERADVVRKLTVLMYRFWPQIVTFTRRQARQLDEWASRPNIGGWYDSCLSGEALQLLAQQAIPYIRGGSHNNRYTALNTMNLATIEFRIFRGTLKRDTLIASIQFCNNMCLWAMSHTWDDVQTATFLDVMHIAHFDELDTYLVVRGLETVPATVHRVPDFAGADGLDVSINGQQPAHVIGAAA